MNQTEKARRSDSLHYGADSRRTLCDMVADREQTIDGLHADNAKLRELCEWLLNPYRLGAVTGEGVDKQWCRETYDEGSYRLRELGMEVDE